MISATIIKDSIHKGNRITTFELEYPRWIHAELMTHRMFSRNAASSRAIPVKTTAKQIKESPEEPIEWGANKPGMQSTEEISMFKLLLAKKVWRGTAWMAAKSSEVLASLGVHKQWANRVAEYAQTYKVVVTATEFDNFFHLRNHADAQPEIKELAKIMLFELSRSVPFNLRPNEWHLPYTHCVRDSLGKLIYLSEKMPIGEGNETVILPSISLEIAKKISVSACAQVSYRKLDTSITKAIKIHDMLVKAEVIHASPFEHLATPMFLTKFNHALGLSDWCDGTTHCDRNGDMWSGNFKGWVQYRHLIANNTCTDYKS